MEAVSHVLLLDSHIKSQLSNFIQDRITSWSKDWGISDSLLWNVSINTSTLSSFQDVSGLFLDNLFLISEINALNTASGLSSYIISEKVDVKNSDLLSDVAYSCIEDFQGCLLKSTIDEPLVLKSCARKGESNDFFSGSIQVEVSVEDFSFSFLLSGIVVDKILSGYLSERVQPQGGFQSINDSFAAEKVSCSASYGHAELSIGDLLSIKEGDVIRLQEKVDDPVSIYNSSGDKLFSGDLGVSDGFLAVTVLNNGV